MPFDIDGTFLPIVAMSTATKVNISFVLLVFAGLLIFFIVSGIRKVPVGAKGVVIFLGRRTEEILPEGISWSWPWLTSLQVMYVRERQIDVPKAEYYTADRARISFKTVLRVVVSDPRALFDQGPGTYLPFTREGFGDFSHGSQEENVALASLVQNSIRESVRSLTIRDVMFGARSEHVVRDRILSELSQTIRRWGLNIVDVWLTDIDADDHGIKQAMQSEVKEVFSGRGQMVKDEVQISKGALFGKVAMDLAEDVRQRLGRDVSVEEVSNFLMASYQNDRALEVALKSAETDAGGFMQHFYLHHMGVPLPVQPAAGRLAGKQQLAPLNVPALHQGTWIVGREGDIVVDWDGVSRHHARLEVQGHRMTITDLGSTNGTFVNSQKLAPHTAVPVETADVVRFGQNVNHTGDDLLRAING